MSVKKTAFGVTKQGEPVDSFTLSNGTLEAEVLTYGGVVRALRVPDRNGKPVDVVLGYDEISGYETESGYLGTVVGRYANRIANARCVLDGETILLTANEGKNQLHGGSAGFHAKVFTPEITGENSLRLTCHSPHGEEGFPGELRLNVTYTVTKQGLAIHYEAVSDKATYCNITNHSYFNLNGNGEGDILNHRLTIDAASFTPVGSDSLPLAMARPVKNTVFDFTGEKPIGQDIDANEEQLHNVGGYDHNFVLNPAQGLRLAARLAGDKSGIVMECWTNKPGVQLYTANGLRTSQAKGGGTYSPRQGVCLETHFFPDSPNHPEWGDIVLRPGSRYDYRTEYRFSVPHI